MREREIEMEGKLLQHSMIERELIMMKQKYQLKYSRHYSKQNSSEKMREEKENIPIMDKNGYNVLGSTMDSSLLNTLYQNESGRIGDSIFLEKDSLDKSSSTLR